MAVYVQKARQRGIQSPIILASEFIHFAFNKSAELTGAQLILVPSDPVSKKVCLHELRKYIIWYGAKNIATIAVAAPNFPLGVIDDIEGSSKLALDYNIPCHVDSCLGGFVTIFLEDNDELKTQ